MTFDAEKLAREHGLYDVNWNPHVSALATSAVSPTVTAALRAAYAAGLEANAEKLARDETRAQRSLQSAYDAGKAVGRADGLRRAVEIAREPVAESFIGPLHGAGIADAKRVIIDRIEQELSNDAAAAPPPKFEPGLYWAKLRGLEAVYRLNSTEQAEQLRAQGWTIGPRAVPPEGF